MFDAIGRGFGYAVRFGILWLVDALSLLLTQWIVPGVTIAAGGSLARLALAVTAAFLLTIVNLLIRPFVFLIARPLGWAALFAVSFLVNAAALWITAWLMPGFTVTPAASLLGGLVFALFNAVFTGILDVDEEGSWYQNQIEKRAREQPSARSGAEERGLLMLEIDGLSYWHVQQGIERGLLPTLRRMVEEDGYVLSAAVRRQLAPVYRAAASAECERGPGHRRGSRRVWAAGGGGRICQRAADGDRQRRRQAADPPGGKAGAAGRGQRCAGTCSGLGDGLRQRQRRPGLL